MQHKVDHAEVQRLHREGMRVSHIAKQVGLSRQGVYNILARATPVTATVNTSDENPGSITIIADVPADSVVTGVKQVLVRQGWTIRQ